MELLELLEQRVVTLLEQVNFQREEIAMLQADNISQTEAIAALNAGNASQVELITKLEADNASLREEVETGLAILEEENRSLKDSLEHERTIKENVRGRIDMLLAQIKDTADKA